jgi:hypothetical protein
MDLSTSAAGLLAELADIGIDLKPVENGIRFRPRAAMTPSLLRRLQAHKAELLSWMDLAELNRSIDQHWKNRAWIDAWARRLQAAQDADFDALRRVLQTAMEVAARHHERRDWTAFASAQRYLRNLASGEEWNRAVRTPVEFPPD